jgi:two-component sensor histidine kinase
MLSHRIIGLVGLALLPALAIQGYNEYALRDARRQAVRRIAMGAVKAVQDDLAQFAEAGRQMLTVLARERSLRDRDLGECSDFLRESAERVTGSTIIALANPDGTVVCSSLGHAATGYRVDDRSYFRRGMESGAFTVGEYLTGRGTQRPTLQLVQPLSAADGTRTGLIYMGYDPSFVGARLMHAGIPANASLTVSDRNGIVLVRSPDPDAWVGRPLPEDFRSRLAGNVGKVGEMRGLAGTERIMATLAPGGALDGIVVSVGLSRESAFSDVDAATRRGVFLILLGGILAVWAGLAASQVAFKRPIARLAEVSRAWRAGDLSVRNGAHDRSEFGQLRMAFDAMADALQGRDSELRTELGRGRDLQEQQVAMLHELNHRVKNTLATVQTLARQSRGDEAGSAQLEQRILALSKTHDLLVRDDWTGASWREILENEFAPYPDAGRRFVLDGPDVELPPRYVLALGMTVHELTTNAAKYGALSNDAGTIRVAWDVAAGDDGVPRLRVEWRETGGPPVREPLRKGFGTRMITGGVPRELSGEVRIVFDPEGVRCLVDVPLLARPSDEPARPSWSSLAPARPAA